ncbi:ankyrin-3-like [Trichogramma pretiosum]|uniref:ankyrin-3-like n=1 Tax=Trichogramma pretiosum TaxID=7493 RepID=UPI000C71AAE8|nr:ankyrin-3-like [Trichogramma pretiosum]
MSLRVVGDPELFEKLKDLINKINWNIEEERCNFLVQFFLMICQDVGTEYPFPAVQHYLRPEQIQRLLWDSINYEDKELGYDPGDLFIEVAGLEGYKDEPDVDENGIISPRRSTPIHQAVKNCEKPRDWIQVIGDLFQIYNRFDVNYTDETGYTHFHAACQFGCVEAVQSFLEHGQDPNCIVPQTGDSALHIVSSCPELNNDMMVLLLRGGADSNLANKQGLTPLHTIAELCWDAKIVIEQFFLTNDELNQLVHIDARDKLGNTPLHLALKEGWAKVVEVLLRRGASPNLANDGGHTPLHVICARDQFHADDLAEFFFKINDELNQRVQIDARDKLGRTPLQLALSNLGVYTVKSLLNRGVDLSNFVLRNSSQFDERFQSGLYKIVNIREVLLLMAVHRQLT